MEFIDARRKQGFLRTHDLNDEIESHFTTIFLGFFFDEEPVGGETEIQQQKWHVLQIK